MGANPWNSCCLHISPCVNAVGLIPLSSNYAECSLLFRLDAPYKTPLELGPGVIRQLDVLPVPFALSGVMGCCSSRRTIQQMQRYREGGWVGIKQTFKTRTELYPCKMYFTGCRLTAQNSTSLVIFIDAYYSGAAACLFGLMDIIFKSLTLLLHNQVFLLSKEGGGGGGKDTAF